MITLKSLPEIEPGKTLWDSGRGSVSGFGARRQRSESITFVLKYRNVDGRQRWFTIGRHGAPWTPDMARNEARRILAEVASGGDPGGKKQEMRKAATVADHCDAYIKAAEEGRF